MMSDRINCCTWTSALNKKKALAISFVGKTALAISFVEKTALAILTISFVQIERICSSLHFVQIPTSTSAVFLVATSPLLTSNIIQRRHTGYTLNFQLHISF